MNQTSNSCLTRSLSHRHPFAAAEIPSLGRQERIRAATAIHDQLKRVVMQSTGIDVIMTCSSARRQMIFYLVTPVSLSNLIRPLVSLREMLVKGNTCSTLRREPEIPKLGMKSVVSRLASEEDRFNRKFHICTASGRDGLFDVYARRADGVFLQLSPVPRCFKQLLPRAAGSNESEGAGADF